MTSSFRWTESRKARVRSAVRAYNAAITRREKELDSVYALYLPKRVTVKEIMSRISNVNDFRRIVGYKSDAARHRYSELTRILKSANPRALEFTIAPTGVLTTNYAKREYDFNQRAKKRQRAKAFKEMSTELFDGDTAYDFDSMSASEYAAMTSDNVLTPEGGEADIETESIDAQTKWEWEQEDARAYREQMVPDAMYGVWLSVWQDPSNFHSVRPNYQEVIDALEWLAENRTDVLNKMFNSSADEMNPQFITESGGDFNPYVNMAYDARHNRAVVYVLRFARGAGYNG